MMLINWSLQGEALSIVMTGRDLQEYNFTSVWNCNVTFTVSSLLTHNACGSYAVLIHVIIGS